MHKLEYIQIADAILKIADDALLKIDEVAAATSLSAPTIYRRLRDGTFPAPIHLSKRCTRWRAGTVRRWVQELGA